jgi:hypothetical protein
MARIQEWTQRMRQVQKKSSLSNYSNEEEGAGANDSDIAEARGLAFKHDGWQSMGIVSIDSCRS